MNADICPSPGRTSGRHLVRTHAAPRARTSIADNNPSFPLEVALDLAYDTELLEQIDHLHGADHADAVDVPGRVGRRPEPAVGLIATASMPICRRKRSSTTPSSVTCA